MSELWQIALLFGVGALAGFINIMAGGGSSITLPTLIFLGLDGAMANGTNRIAIFLQNVFAMASFKQQKVSAFKQSLTLAVWTLPGAVIGALVAVRISSDAFKHILGIIMIGIVLTMLLPTRRGKFETSDAGRKNWLIYPALFGIGFYGGFIQMGVGFLFMAALYHLLRMNLVYVNMHKIVIVLIYTLPALAIFIWTGNVNWGLGLSLAAGNAFGGWWSARLAVKGGERVIRIVLSIAIVIMAAKLLGGF